MKLREKSLLICFLSFVLYACATDSYTYYGLNVRPIEQGELAKGRLLAKEQSKDLALTECLPNARSKSPCIVVFKEEYFKIMREIDALNTRLKACEAK